ncbi:hypothetical protein ABZ404_19080 [Streptomyces sp. NPDC005878]|uniref:hypothetical protein n=2 Tax=unclassified Streptomyces TaxID=2593676 RepID=UPI00340C5734
MNSVRTLVGQVSRIAAAVVAASALTLVGANASTAATGPTASASASTAVARGATGGDVLGRPGDAKTARVQAVYTRRMRSVATHLCVDDSNIGLRHFGCQDPYGPYANFQRFRLDTY